MKTTILLGAILLSVSMLFTGSKLKHDAFTVKDTGRVLEYKMGETPVFTYNYAMVYPPAGIDTVYKRSGFIHPLRALNGAVLTNLSPADHYHHFGLWYAWTKTTFEGNEIDFWNLNKKQGTVRFCNFEKISDNGFKARLEHIVYPDSPKEKIAMNEDLEIKIGEATPDGYYMDYNTTLRCAGSSPITFEAYRYGGFVIRTREDWNDKNAEMLTSKGLTRTEADGSHARWCYFQGKTEKGDAGILIISRPENLNHPEPMRVWDKTVNPASGDVMWNFSPTKEQAYTLMPGKSFTLSYRIYILTKKIDATIAEELYKQL